MTGPTLAQLQAEVEHLAGVIERLVDVQAGLVAAVARLTPPTPAPEPSARPALRVVEGGRR